MRRLPLGNDEPSGSPLINSEPVNSVMALPSGLVTMNPSCFSAVMLVSGKKTWEKNLTPLASAQSFMAAATTSAVAGSSGAPVWTVVFISLKALLERHSSMVARLKTSDAQISLSGPPVTVSVPLRSVMAAMASLRRSLALISVSILCG